MEPVAEKKEGFRDLAEKLASVRVSVRGDLEISRQIFEGKPAYVIRDPIYSQSLRLTPSDYQLFVGINSQLTLGNHFDRLVASGVLRAEDNERFYQFVLHLHQVGLLVLPLADGKSLHRRFQQKRIASRRISLMKMLFLRIPLVRPDRFLERTVPFVRPLFTRGFACLWLVSILTCLCLAILNWHEFSGPLRGMLAIKNLPLLWCLLVGLKTLHELGHAYACKRFGGHVPEIGVFLILLTPCAYVDASSSWGFTHRYQRILVGLAGMYFESLAAIAAFVIWFFTDPGLLHSAALYAIVLSTAVTVGFNGNPLMRYDGYFILSDVLNIPNLRGEAQSAFAAFFKKVFFGVPIANPSAGALRKWFLRGFGVCTLIYATLILVSIGMLLALNLPTIGPFVAVFMVGSVFLGSVRRKLTYLVRAPELSGRRKRAFAVSGLMLALVITTFGFVPLKHKVSARGIVSRSNEQVIHAPVSGFLVERNVETGMAINEGTVLLCLSNHEIDEAIHAIEAQIQDLRISLIELVGSDRHQARQTQLKLRRLEQDLLALLDEKDQLVVRASSQGQVARLFDLSKLGRYVEAGEPLVLTAQGSLEIRAIISAQDFSHSAPKPGARVEVWLGGATQSVAAGIVRRCSPAAIREMDVSSLTEEGGGTVVTSDTGEPSEVWFEVIIALDDEAIHSTRLGTTAFVKLPAPPITLGEYLMRRGRRMIDQIQVAG